MVFEFMEHDFKCEDDLLELLKNSEVVELPESEREPSPSKPELKWYEKMFSKGKEFLALILRSWLLRQTRNLYFWFRVQIAWLRMKPHQRISEKELNRSIELVLKYIDFVKPKSKEIYPIYRSGDSVKTTLNGSFKRRGKKSGGITSFVKPTDELGQNG